MFDMSRVFEALLAARLRRALPDCSVDEQASHRFDLDGRFMLRPDLVVRRRGQPTLVLDAKWKRMGSSADVADADLRQAFASPESWVSRKQRWSSPSLMLTCQPFTRCGSRTAAGSGSIFRMWQ